MTFPIPDLQKYYKSNPGHYLGHLIGHEGPGSLLSELKSKGWSKPSRPVGISLPVPPQCFLPSVAWLCVCVCVCSEGWVNTLVGGQKEGARGFMFFIINVDLTEEGLCEWPSLYGCHVFPSEERWRFAFIRACFLPAVHVEDIVFHMFQYIQKLRTEGPQEWVFQECKVINL